MFCLFSHYKYIFVPFCDTNIQIVFVISKYSFVDRNNRYRQMGDKKAAIYNIGNDSVLVLFCRFAVAVPLPLFPLLALQVDG